MLHVDTLISAAICFCLYCGFYLAYSQTGWCECAKERWKRTNSGTQKADLCETVYCITFVIINHLVFEKMSAKEDTINLKKKLCGVICFLFLLEKMQTECYSMICEACRDVVMNCRKFFHWHEQFREDCMLFVAVKHLVDQCHSLPL